MSDPPPREDPAPPETTPLSFKLMVGLAALYLGWRLVQGIAALVRWLG